MIDVPDMLIKEVLNMGRYKRVKLKEDSIDDILQPKTYYIPDVWDDSKYDIAQAAKRFGLSLDNLDYDYDSQTMIVTVDGYDRRGYEKYSKLYNWVVNNVYPEQASYELEECKKLRMKESFDLSDGYELDVDEDCCVREGFGIEDAPGLYRRIYNIIRDNHINADILDTDDSDDYGFAKISIDGDWKHDHLRLKYLLEKAFDTVIWRQTKTYPSDSDFYEAEYQVYLADPKDGEVNESFRRNRKNRKRYVKESSVVTHTGEDIYIIPDIPEENVDEIVSFISRSDDVENCNWVPSKNGVGQLELVCDPVLFQMILLWVYRKGLTLTDKRIWQIMKDNGISENLKTKKYRRNLKEQDVEIEVKHEGVLEVPEGKNVDDLPISHFEKLVKKKGLSKITKALNNLQVWNKNKDPKLSKWAGDMIDKLNKRLNKKESFRKSKKHSFVEYYNAKHEFKTYKDLISKLRDWGYIATTRDSLREPWDKVINLSKDGEIWEASYAVRPSGTYILYMKDVVPVE